MPRSPTCAKVNYDTCRPHLHKFLESVYEHFDIVIWSANSMKWMKVKMEALGVLNSDKFKVTFMLDYRAMLTVHNDKYGEHLSVLRCVHSSIL